METLSDWAALINFGLGLTILGFILRLTRLHSKVLKERLEGAKERLEGAKDQSNWNRERLEAEKAAREELRVENEKLRVRLQEALSNSGVTLGSITVGEPVFLEGRSEGAFVLELASQLERQQAEDPSPSPEIDLELAKAEMAQGNWRAAATLLDRYVAAYPDSFEVQFARGVAWANTRSNNAAALRSYNEAIALLPAEIESPDKARAFTYRAAVLKRLGRLDEADADLMQALRLLQDTPSRQELDDLYYNIASIAAMRGDKANMLRYLTEIEDGSYAGAVAAHLEDYFKPFANDMELQNWLESRR